MICSDDWFKEWKAVSDNTRCMIKIGILYILLITITFLVGMYNCLNFEILKNCLSGIILLSTLHEIFSYSCKMIPMIINYHDDEKRDTKLSIIATVQMTKWFVVLTLTLILGGFMAPHIVKLIQ
jgi:hypothetical protein